MMRCFINLLFLVMFFVGLALLFGGRFKPQSHPLTGLLQTFLKSWPQAPSVPKESETLDAIEPVVQMPSDGTEFVRCPHCLEQNNPGFQICWFCKKTLRPDPAALAALEASRDPHAKPRSASSPFYMKVSPRDFLSKESFQAGMLFIPPLLLCQLLVAVILQAHPLSALMLCVPAFGFWAVRYVAPRRVEPVPFLEKPWWVVGGMLVGLAVPVSVLLNIIPFIAGQMLIGAFAVANGMPADGLSGSLFANLLFNGIDFFISILSYGGVFRLLCRRR